MAYKEPLTPEQAKAKKYGRTFEKVDYKAGFAFVASEPIKAGDIVYIGSDGLVRKGLGD